MNNRSTTEEVNKLTDGAQGLLDDGLLGLIIRLYDNPFVAKLIAVLIAIVVSFVLLSLSKMVALFIKNKIMDGFVIKDNEEARKVGILVGDVVFYAMAMFSLFISFNIVGINLSYLLGGISIGVGFAFRETLSNMIAGIMIFSTKEYQLGNIVEFKMFGTIFGRIEEINMKHIVIRSFDLRRHIIPNSKFLKKNIKTYNAESLLKYEFDIIVDSSINVVAALPLIKQTINSFAFVISKEYTEVLLDSFTDKNVKIKIHFYFDPNNGYTVEVLKSAIQIELFTLIKSLSKKSEKKEEKKQTSSEEIQTITTPTVVGVVTH